MCYLWQVNNLPMMYRQETKEEFEERARRYRVVLRKEVDKSLPEPIQELTIRQAIDVFSAVAGYRQDALLSEMSYNHDLDDPGELGAAVRRVGHMFDLVYAQITLYPVYVSLDDGREGWVYWLLGRPGHPAFMARYAERLQDLGVPFVMDDPQGTVRRLGYWIRSMRLDMMKQETAEA